ncbi:MAG: DUF4340 domain-containing protein [Betaproteobacteria bacterium]|nr:DUF4340 domain-containing protein [Betaproteobacteria bacterium]
MKSRILLNLTLIAALVALSLYTYFKPWQDAAPSVRLTQLKRDDITRIAIEPRSAAAIKLEKLDGAWRIVAPLTAQAEATQVDRLVDIVNANAKQKLSNADLSQFDLNPPQVRVTLNDQAIAFGRINDITYEQYVATADGVYLVPPLYGYGISTEVGKLLSRRLLDQGEVPVSFNFGRYRIERDDKGTWTASGEFAAAKDQPLPQDDFNRWADEWRYTSALSVEPDKSSRSREQVNVRFKSGRAVTMRIVQKEPDFQLVRSDNGMRYHFGVEVGRRLLDPRVVARK